jgi:hypothetical protein
LNNFSKLKLAKKSGQNKYVCPGKRVIFESFAKQRDAMQYYQIVIDILSGFYLDVF